MPDKKITTDNSTNQVTHSNPATVPQTASAGQPVTVVKGGNAPAVHGQIPTSGGVYGPVFDNPGA